MWNYPGAAARKAAFYLFHFVCPLLLVFFCALQFKPAWFAADTSNLFDDPWFMVFFGSIGLAWSIISVGIGNLNDPYTWTNFRTEKQVKATVKLIADCTDQLVIFSGEFHHSVYNDDRIIQCLEGLDDEVSTFLFHSSEQIDPKSDRLAALAARKDWKFISTPLEDSRHFIIVDGSDLRVEWSREDNGDFQYARYIKCRPDFARKVFTRFREKLSEAKLLTSSCQLPRL